MPQRFGPPTGDDYVVPTLTQQPGSGFPNARTVLDGLREQANRLIEQSMNEWQRVSQGDALEG
ncbi:hypothetical protein ACFWZY_20250 [Streptomyces sp. NPDC058992]|uniref:hypothetical protein n=1 Tax=Streptomyces sp. NPDC058992 TaxID=3346688 RepID=UPI0036B3AEB8